MVNHDVCVIWHLCITDPLPGDHVTNNNVGEESWLEVNNENQCVQSTTWRAEKLDIELVIIHWINTSCNQDESIVK